MSDYLYNKIDFIIMIVLALFVAFIIGVNIIQIIDSKLSSVTINVPSQNCNIPPIYFAIDKESGDFKQIKLDDIHLHKTTNNIESKTHKLNDVVNVISNESNYNETFDTDDSNTINIENFSNNTNSNSDFNSDFNSNSNSNNDKYLFNKNIENMENFGGIQDYPLLYDNNRKILLSDRHNSELGLNIINSKTKFDTNTDPNYNMVNNIPLLVAPDTDVPNRAGSNAKGYYLSKVKLIEDNNSPLMKLAKSNANKINQMVAKCTLADSKTIPQVNGTFDGYNAFVDLRTDSYANITSIGKSMLAPYTSYPVPS